MSIICELFAPQLRRLGFFQEWARFIKTNVPTDALAAFVLEGLRDAENNERRMAFTYFTTFMKTRTWTEASCEIAEHFDEGDREVLGNARAGELYDRLKTIVSAQLEVYYDQLLRERDEKRKEFRTQIEADPYEKIEAKIIMLIESHVTAAMDALGQKIATDIKKHLDEGENWKGPTEGGPVEP